MKFTTVSPQIENAFKAKMEEVLNICRQKSGKNIPSIPLKFSQMGRRAGICHIEYKMSECSYKCDPRSTYIVINPDFLKNYYDDMLNDTCPHEVAHYVSTFLYGQRGDGHGWNWKSVMNWMGISAANRCHEYSLEGVKVRRTNRNYQYSCNCKIIHMLTLKKHERHQWYLKNGSKGLACSQCHTPIVYQGFTFNGTFYPYKKIENRPEPMVVTVVSVAPVVPTPEPTYKLVTKFINGMLVNERVPINA